MDYNHYYYPGNKSLNTGKRYISRPIIRFISWLVLLTLILTSPFATTFKYYFYSRNDLIAFHEQVKMEYEIQYYALHTRLDPSSIREGYMANSPFYLRIRQKYGHKIRGQRIVSPDIYEWHMKAIAKSFDPYFVNYINLRYGGYINFEDYYLGYDM